MERTFVHSLMQDPNELAGLGEWSEDVYRALEAYRAGRMSEEAFRAKYGTEVVILCLDMTGFTQTAIRYGELQSLLRIYDVQQVCGQIFKEFNARLIRAFADDLVALFEDPYGALDAALEVHRRIGVFNRSELASAHPAECCIGLGYGKVFAIGPNLAMGDEMNRASKLGEDTARANEILITERMCEAVNSRPDCLFLPHNKDDLPFPFYSVVPRRERKGKNRRLLRPPGAAALSR